MDPATVSAIISAAAGIFGAVIGSAGSTINARIEAKRVTSKNAGYLAILVSSHLDDFATGCASVVGDGGEADNTGMTYSQVKAPEFSPRDLDVDWKSLPVTLMGRVLDLPFKISEVGRLLSSDDFRDPPDFCAYFVERQLQYSNLGLEAIELAALLRKQVGLSPHPVGPWDRADYMTSRRAEILEMRAKREHARENMLMTNPDLYKVLHANYSKPEGG